MKHLPARREFRIRIPITIDMVPCELIFLVEEHSIKEVLHRLSEAIMEAVNEKAEENGKTLITGWGMSTPTDMKGGE